MFLGAHVTLISVKLPFHRSGLTLPDVLKSAHPGRQEKFLAGRYCAHEALKKAGAQESFEIPIGPDGAPIWPSGWVGSITHTEGHAAAAVGKLSHILSIGIDSEPIMKANGHSKVANRILTQKELTVLCPLGMNELEWATFVFSAKESIYKCLRPLCGKFFGFEDAEMDEVDEKSGRFSFHLEREIGGPFTKGWKGEGYFKKEEGLFHTGVLIENEVK